MLFTICNKHFWRQAFFYLCLIVCFYLLLKKLLLYGEACNELGGPISASLHPDKGNTICLEKMLQGWRAVGNTMYGLTGPRI